MIGVQAWVLSGGEITESRCAREPERPHWTWRENFFLRHPSPKSTDNQSSEKTRLRLPVLERSDSFQLHH